MQALSFLGKFKQLSALPPARWGRFIGAWLQRHRTGNVPCVLPGTSREVDLPRRDFYESYAYFAEIKPGRRELRYFLGQLRPGDVLFDVGAFRGVFSLAAVTRFGADITVHAFEPVSTNLASLEKVLALNSISSVRVVNATVGDTEPLRGKVDLSTGMFTNSETFLEDGGALIAHTTLDDYVRETGVTPTVIKLDVEGFEAEVLAGGRELLTSKKPRIWLEMHPQLLAAKGQSETQVRANLESLGYRLSFFEDYRLPTRNLGYHVWCEA